MAPNVDRVLDEWALSSSDPLRLHQVLGELKLMFENVRGRGRDARPTYFDAVNHGEAQLDSFIDGVGWLEGLHTPRYWDIQRTSQHFSSGLAGVA